jgi:hypothetical protein
MSKITQNILWAFAIVFVVMLVIPRNCSTGSNGVVSDTTRVVVYDTIPYFNPNPKDSVDIKSITERLPIADKEINFPIKDTTNHFKDTSEMVTDSNPLDSIAVEIPITQKVYEDSTYKAYVSGFKPSLDSIFVYPSKEVQTIKIKPKPKRWGIGVQVGYGLTLQPQPKFAPYIGVGISYNIFNF